MPERNVSSWNSMITGYCQYRMVREAREMFDRMEKRNNVSWLIMISGYVEMTIVGLNNLDLVGSIRTMAIKLGYEEDVVVGTAILNAYSRNGSLDDAYKLDDAVTLYESGSCDKGVEIKTTMLAAYAQKGNISKARRIFDEIKYLNMVMWNAMVSGYAQNGMLEEANLMFVRMPVRNAVTWSTMISGFVQNGKCKEALELFVELNRTSNIPSYSGFTTALSACANIGDEEMGKQIHLLTIKTRCQYNLHIGNGLITMYAKCKNMEYVSQAFRTMQKMPKWDEVLWTAIISAFLQDGEVENALKFFLDMLATGMKPTELIITRFLSACKEAIYLFEQMEAAGVLPDEISFLGVISACSNAGLVEKGWTYFNSMSQNYGITPSDSHYTCMIDLLAKAGQLSDDQALIKSMPVKPGCVT
ncbi:hypothetical protein EZV62_018250 [Acer yangbiense]|uniref:Pentacotripeptide-repeat region of PRORP domain-containing protein n=1 Tax=Acer yangbiense TaxID=1000413 RepID=A0A5C7HIV5_9ROSI|nr:hypothetical protein EZV62_018250 [Acer yangbiense]